MKLPIHKLIQASVKKAKVEIFQYNPKATVTRNDETWDLLAAKAATIAQEAVLGYINAEMGKRDRPKMLSCKTCLFWTSEDQLKGYCGNKKFNQQVNGSRQINITTAKFACKHGRRR